MQATKLKAPRAPTQQTGTDLPSHAHTVYGFNASGTSPEQWFDAPVNTEFIKVSTLVQQHILEHQADYACCLQNPLRADADGLEYDKWW